MSSSKKICLLEFIDWRYSQSCWYFRPSFMSYCPSNLLSSSPLPPPPSLCQSTVYTDNVLLGMSWGGGRGCWVVLETKFCWSLTLCIWPDSEPTKLLDQPKQKPRRGGCLRQKNTCHRVPLQVNFLDDDILHCFLIFLCFRATSHPCCHPMNEKLN